MKFQFFLSYMCITPSLLLSVPVKIWVHSSVLSNSLPTAQRSLCKGILILSFGVQTVLCSFQMTMQRPRETLALGQGQGPVIPWPRPGVGEGELGIGCKYFCILFYQMAKQTSEFGQWFLESIYCVLERWTGGGMGGQAVVRGAFVQAAPVAGRLEAREGHNHQIGDLWIMSV